MIINKDIPGYSLQFDIREATGHDIVLSDQIVIDEMFNENVYDIHDDTFDTNDTMIDVGANIGATSILAWTKGARKIIAFEPEQNNYRQLKKNIKLNKLKSVITPIKLAIADKVGTSEIFNGQGGSFISESNGAPSELRDKLDVKKESIDTTTLDLALEDLNKIALLKIDCEGAEYMIIEAASLDALRKCQRIVMEYHQTDEITFGKMIAKLSLVFNLRVFGHYDTFGGQIDGRRY